MNLNEGDQGFLRPGKYTAEIVKVFECSAKTGTLGTSVTFRDVESGVTIRERFWHTMPDGNPSKARYRIRILAECCGFDKKARENFEPQSLMGKTCGIVVIPNKDNTQYCEVSDVFKLDSKALIPPSLAASNTEKEPEAKSDKEPPFDKDEEIPF